MMVDLQHMAWESNEEEERHEDDPDYSAEEEFIHEEHS